MNRLWFDWDCKSGTWLKRHTKLALEACLGFGLSLVILLYAFSPFRWEPCFIFQNQTEPLAVITILSWIGCAGILIKQVYTSGLLKVVTLIDLLLLACLVYLLLQLIFYPVDKEYLFTITCLAAAYFLFHHIPKQLAAGLLYLLPVLVVVQIIYGYNRLAYPWQGISDITGAFGNTGIFGGFVAMGFVAALGLILSAKQPVIRIALGILLVPLTIQLLYSQSRAAWVATIAGALMLLWPSFRKLTKLKAVILLSALLIVAVLFAPKLYHFKKDSADGRLLMWTVSWNMIKEKPLTGFGTSGFQQNYLLYQGEYFKDHPDSPWADLADDTSSPFNEWLKIGVEQGILGLLFVAGIIFLAFSHTANPSVLQAVLATLIGFSCFSYPFEFVAFQLLGVFCLASMANTQTSVVISSSRNLLKNSVMKLPVVCLTVALTGFVLFSSRNYYADVKKWNQITRSYSSSNDRKIAELQTLYPVLKCNALFVLLYARAVHNAGRDSEAIPLWEEAKALYPSSQTLLLLGELYEQTGEHAKALEAWETASHIKPALFAPHYHMAKLYFKLHDYERAKKKAGEIVNKKIKISSPKINRMKREMLILYECDY